MSVVADGQALPFVPETFDLVIATQVFEHFSNPELAAQQIHAVLRPGGVLLAGVAVFAPRFVDQERWRFTPLGTRTMFKSYADVEIIPEVLSIGGIVRTLNVACSTLVHHRSMRFICHRTVCPVLNLVGLALERLNLTANDNFTPNYSVRAPKS